MLSKCIILDLETVPNIINPLWDHNKSDKFPPCLFHKVVAAGYAELDDSLSLVKIDMLGLNRDTEEEALTKLSDVIGDDSMVVTWAGRRFDMPVVTYRCMKYGIQTLWDKDADFRNRYRSGGHMDLQDHMMHFGSADVLKLRQVAPLIGLPGKEDVQGSDVQALIARNAWFEVSSYCTTDVIQTLVLFLRYSYTLGKATKEEHNNSLDSIVAYYKSLDGPTDDYIHTEESAIKQGIFSILSNCDWRALYL